MFYRPQDGHGLPHNPFTAIVSPRPIGWISTRGTLGDNLAPYSFFNAVAAAPPQVMFASNGLKDSLRNIRDSRVFCVNLVGAAQLEAMNTTSDTLPHGTDEFTHAGLARLECSTIPCSRVADAPAALECRFSHEIRLEGLDNFLILGLVTGVHIRDDCLIDGRYDPLHAGHAARLGYKDYAVLRDSFPLERLED